ncbi:MAG TPA: DivIVA domain-containing protein [Ignavibacteria bacterium]
MNISSKDIKKRDFKKGFRGYEPAEVDAFLDTVSSHYEKLIVDNKTLNDRIKSLLSDIDIYRENESNLQKAIVKSQDLGEEIVINARKKAELIIKEAELTSNKLRQDLDNEILNKKQELEEFKYKNDKLIDDIKNYLIEKLNELEDFVKNKKIIKMELANYSDMHNEVIEEEQKQEDEKKTMKKISLGNFSANTNDKSFDDNFEVKK